MEKASNAARAREREDLPPGWQVVPGGKGVYSPPVGKPPGRVHIRNPAKLRQQQQEHKRFENISAEMLFVKKKVKKSQFKQFQADVEAVEKLDRVQFGVSQLSFHGSASVPDHKKMLTEIAKHLYVARQPKKISTEDVQRVMQVCENVSNISNEDPDSALTELGQTLRREPAFKYIMDKLFRAETITSMMSISDSSSVLRNNPVSLSRNFYCDTVELGLDKVESLTLLLSDFCWDKK